MRPLAKVAALAVGQLRMKINMFYKILSGDLKRT